MEDNKFKYSDRFKEILLKIDSNVSKEVALKENSKSINVADLTDNKKLIKLTFDKHKQEIKFGKFIKKIIPNINADDLEEFVNKYKSSQFKSTFKEVKGDEIPYYYKTKNYTKTSEANNSLHESCMNDKSNFLDIYTKNNNFRLLVLNGDDGKIIGRALIVSNVESMDGYKDMEVMLYPYIAYQSLRNKFKDYAEKNNIFFIDDLISSTELKVKIEKSDFEKYPYIDEFQFELDNYLCTYIYINSDGNRKINDIEVKDGVGYRSMDSTMGYCTHHKGYKYYKSIEDFNDGNNSYTFNDIDLRRCFFTKSSFHKDDTILIKEINDEDLINKFGGFNHNIAIHKHLLKLIENKNIDITDFKKMDFILYHFLFNLNGNFEDNVKCKTYLIKGGSISHKIFNCDYDQDLYSRLNNIIFRNKRSLEIIFYIDKTPYFFIFKSKPSGLTLKVYGTKTKKNSPHQITIKKGDLIIGESKPKKSTDKLNKKISEYILKLT